MSDEPVRLESPTFHTSSISPLEFQENCGNSLLISAQPEEVAARVRRQDLHLHTKDVVSGSSHYTNVKCSLSDHFGFYQLFNGPRNGVNARIDSCALRNAKMGEFL